MSVSWDYYDQFDKIEDEYLPRRGEGDTMATQCVTAVTKLVYKWYNDGDVFDNRYGMPGWFNDLSSYANWLYNQLDWTRPILERIYDCTTEDEYENILKDLADSCFDWDVLDRLNEFPKQGSIYEGSYPFKYEEFEEEDEDEWDDWEDDDWDDDDFED